MTMGGEWEENGRRMGGQLDLLHVFVFLLFLRMVSLGVLCLSIYKVAKVAKVATA